MRLREHLDTKVLPEMAKKYHLPRLGLPEVEKMTLNVGVGKLGERKDLLEQIRRDIAAICGQKPKYARAKQSISGFKLRQGQVVGYVATLRGKRMWDFLEKLNKVVLPRMRDFEGIKTNSIDKGMNFTIGLREQTIFPEIASDDVRELWGLGITTTLKNTGNRDAVREYLAALGFIFKQ